MNVHIAIVQGHDTTPSPREGSSLHIMKRSYRDTSIVRSPRRHIEDHSDVITIGY
jgi:hypothetical protein